MKKDSKSTDLYILAYVEGNEVIGFPLGGGSSTNPSLKSYDNLTAARRGKKYFPRSTIVKAVKYEVIE